MEQKFKGPVPACEVCSDKVKGFHFGAWVCAPCEDFFFSFFQEQASIGSCEMEEQCYIGVKNCDTCKYCRLKKCIYVGMSQPDFQAKRSDPSPRSWVYLATMEDDLIDSFVYTIHQAHWETYSKNEKHIENLIRESRKNPSHAAKLVCPMNKDPSNPTKLNRDTVLDKYHGLKDVLKFLTKIPAFLELRIQDQIILTKVGYFLVIFIRYVPLFDWDDFSLYCLNGLKIPFNEMPAKDTEFLANMSELAKKIKNLKLSDREVAVFSLVAMINIRNFPFKNRYLVFRLEVQLRNVLRKLLLKYHPFNPKMMNSLMEIIDLMEEVSDGHSERMELASVEIN